MDPILAGDSTELITSADARSMALWADDKKKAFVDTFKSRAKVAAYILQLTAHTIMTKAMDRRFISYKHQKQINQVSVSDPYDRVFEQGYWQHRSTVGGRNPQELQKIAAERADDVLKKLPVLKDAVKIIDNDTFKLIEDHKALKEVFEANQEKLNDLSEPVVMSELDQNMTLGEFKKYIKKLQESKQALLTEVSKQGRELQEMDATIYKKLYNGLPGLSDAIVKVINEHYERITALDSTIRRVEERVQFGDSVEALQMLEYFEKDEVTVSDTIQAEFTAALEQLKLSVKTRRLKAKK
jgi:hypothetical protein